MFEKEAEEYAEEVYGNRTDIDYYGIPEAFQKGAEFGYNKAMEEIKQNGLALQSDMDKTIEQNIALKKELDKANEWHYVKDGLPEELNDVLCFVIHNEHRYVLQGYLRDGRWVLSPLGTYLNNDDVIAWKEIVFPKESE